MLDRVHENFGQHVADFRRWVLSIFLLTHLEA